MLYRDEHGVGRFPLSDRIYTPIVNCHEVKMNSDGFQYDSRLPFQLPSKEKVNWTLGDSFLTLLYLNLFFFRRGRTSAFLNTSGTIDSANDLFTISLIIGIKVSKHGLSTCVGMGSSSHDFTGAFVKIFLISSVVTGENVVSGVPSNFTSALNMSESFGDNPRVELRSFLILSILPRKNLPNRLAS